ncbi:cytochrome b/b6 domain-containing protein [Isoptericola sp. NPDC056573]|uniref:cytochrome b/b6 domain-containing protein n=1 Tax=Isoptericola sp. NPDC056573 TaxID=3345868 RepID=UPI0036D05DA9
MTRQGLPRRPGGPPWPPVDGADAGTAEVAHATTRADGPTGAGTAGGAAAPGGVRQGLPRVARSTTAGATAEPGAALAQTAPAAAPAAAVGTPLRRGLPRTAGGAPWPPAGVVPPGREPSVPVTPDDRPAEPPPTVEPAPSSPVPEPVAPPVAAAPRRRRLPAWAGRTGIAAAVAAVVFGLLVLAARWWVGTDAGRGFLATYPGTAPMPDDAPVGIPAWLAWQHFFNVFLLVLVVRTGWQVRLQRRPAASWAPRADPGARIGLMAWAHQALDVLWVANGAVYIVLLFVTGQWVRVVPTSWTVVPEALSAGLQYLSLQWPTEDGWVHYNGLQQLAYFVTVFVAAPLAILSGVRMSVYWRSRPAADRLVPIGLARRVHFPVMLYFVAFVVLHVALVLATGARRNLDHMFGARDDGSWVGLAMFLVSVVVIAGAAAAMRPVVVAPVARRFGTVNGR